MKESMIDILRYDYKINRQLNQRIFLFVLRGNQFSNKLAKYNIIRIIFKFLNVLFLEFIFNCDIPKDVQIGKGLKLPHPYGIVISKNTKIGECVTILHQVTIGDLESKSYRTVIGNNCYIGAGAKIIGVEIIGDNSKVGANAVVLKNIPSDSTAVGIYK